MITPKLLQIAVQAVWVYEDDAGHLVQVPSQGVFDAKSWNSIDPAIWTIDQAQSVGAQIEAQRAPLLQLVDHDAPELGEGSASPS